MSDTGKAAQSTLARLVEAAEAAVRAVMDDATARGWKTVDNAAAVALLPGPFRAAIALRDAIAAHRASVDALGAVRGRADPEASIHVVLARAAAEAAEQRAAKAERDMDAAVKQAHADLDAANDHAANLVHEIAQLKATHDTAICRRDQIRDAQRERNAVIDALNETRETLRAGPREQAQDAAKRVVAERDRIYDEREILARDRDRALAERDEARKERDVLTETLRESRAERESTRDALGAGPVEHVVDAAKRVMAELEEVRKRAAQFEAELDEAWEATGVSSTVRGMTDLADVVRSDKRSAKFVREERDDLRVALNEATRQRDEARREAARDREADRRMLKNRDEALDYAAEERDALKAEVQRLRADALNVGGDAVRKAYDLCHAALDAAKAPKVGSSGSCAERIAALAAERDEARRERDDLRSDRDENYEQVRAKAPTTRPSDGAVAQRLPDSLSFSELRAVNVVRCRASWHDEKKWTPTDWACALAGEVGEACDVAKKLKRLADGIEHDKSRTKAALVEELGHELADVICYADLLAASLEIDLGAAVRTKFNLVSERVGSSIRLPAATKTEAHDACPRASTPPPDPAPLDPRALVICEGAVRVWAAIPRANGFSVTDQVFEAAEILRAAEAEARKGVGK